jgi:transposase
MVDCLSVASANADGKRWIYLRLLAILHGSVVTAGVTATAPPVGSTRSGCSATPLSVGAERSCLPEGHLARFISDTLDTLDTLDLGAFHARYDKDGPRNQPFHPAMMVKVLVNGYATGVFSPRKIARKLHEDVAFRVLAAGNFSAHRTIRDFRAFHLKELSDLFLQVVRLACEMGLVKLGSRSTWP